MDILQLLQAAGIPGQTPGFGSESGVTGQYPSNDIQVSAPPKRTVGEDLRSEPSPRKTDELVQRKGMFGVKGTLRDILGLVGDSLLVGSGKQAVYRPAREQEKLGSAIYGYNEDPTAAIDRAALVNPEVAIDLQGRYDTGRRIDQQVAAQKIAGQQKAGSVMSSWLGAINSSKDPANQYGLVRDKLRAYAAANGVADLYDLPDEYDPDVAAVMARGGIDPDDQVDNARADMTADDQRQYRAGQLSVAQRRASESARHNRKMESRPTGSKAASRPTATNVDAQVLEAIQNGTATPNQQRYFESRLKRGSTAKPSLLERLRGGSSGGPPPPPNGGSFRKVK